MNRFDFSIQWHLTSRCINRCKHCYMFDDSYDEICKSELELQDWFKIYSTINDFEKHYGVEIGSYAITGGDPFSHEQCYEFLEFLKSQDKSVSVMSIPERILNKDDFKRISSLNLDGFQLSLDGMESTHDAIRGKGSFEKTIKALKKLDNTSIPKSVMYTIHKDNYNDLFPLINYLKSLDIEMVFAFDFLIFEGNAENKKKNLFSQEEINTLLNQYKVLAEESRVNRWKMRLAYKPNLFNVYDTRDDSQFSFCGGCHCGVNSICILANGDVYPCRRMPIKIGNLLKDSFEKLFLQNELMRQLRRRSFYSYCGDCRYFKKCRGCPALAYSVTGDPFEKIPYCYLKSVIDTTHPIEIEQDIMCSNVYELEYILNSFGTCLLKVNEKDNLVKVLKTAPDIVYSLLSK